MSTLLNSHTQLDFFAQPSRRVVSTPAARRTDPESSITQQELKARLHYDPGTGVFTRIMGLRGQPVGVQAGVLRHNGYRSIDIYPRKYFEHRLAWLYMTGKWPTDQIDHINGIRNDNRWANLRQASNSENSKNQRIRTNNTSGCCGVSWRPQRRKWRAYIKAHGKVINLGSFTEKHAAITARKAAEVAHGFHANHGSARSIYSATSALRP